MSKSAVLGSSMSFDLDEDDSASSEEEGIQRVRCKKGSVFGYINAAGQVQLIEDWDISCMNGQWIVKSGLFVDVITGSNKIGCFKRQCSPMPFFSKSDISTSYIVEGSMKTVVTRWGVEKLMCPGKVAILAADGSIIFTEHAEARCHKGRWMYGSLALLDGFKISCIRGRPKIRGMCQPLPLQSPTLSRSARRSSPHSTLASPSSLKPSVSSTTDSWYVS